VEGIWGHPANLIVFIRVLGRMWKVSEKERERTLIGSSISICWMFIESVMKVKQDNDDEAGNRPTTATYSAFVSGVGRSPIVVSVSVDQYKLPKYFLVSVA